MAVSMRINSEHNGIELLFPDSERPNANVRTALKEQGFRWHNKGKYWFARQTPDRLTFAQTLTGVGEKEVPVQKESEKKREAPKKAKQEKTLRQENTFAAVYESIGGMDIRDSSDISLHSIPGSGVYCKDTQAFFRHTWGMDDCITVTDLTNAGRNGKTCPIWKLYSVEQEGIVGNHLTSEENLQTCADLLKALQEGKTMDNVRVYTQENKGVETFSPFLEVKPLTCMPETWNKRNFTNALLSGQIYMGQVDYRYTDDYAIDAAYDFNKGVGINIPIFARDVVEGWCSTYYVRNERKDTDKKTCTIGFSEHSNSSKTLTFDLNCDIREGKRRADEKAAGIKAYNDMLKSSCIKVPPESIDANKIYCVTSLETSTNTGIYGTKTELMQGSSLLIEANAPELSYLDILSASEQQIIPDKLYEVSSFYHSHSYEPDDRIIDCGNKLQLVTGKALLELTAEGVSLPYISEATGEYHSIESARINLQQFINGEKKFMFTGLKSTSAYEKALDKLNREAERAGCPEKKRSGINDLIASAQKRAAEQNSGNHEILQDISR